ncbi:MAG: 3-deoxy-D-manno-octulosonic acid transferase [Gammaproteobacteria bacterium]|nr:3-deoxy-D-manno-octulosonic acid transferase [Gammaproteobacteria bacterium]
MIAVMYNMLLTLLQPCALALIVWRGFRDHGYWRNLSQRFGFGDFLSAPAIWVHAVSVGEVQAAAGLIRALRARYPDSPLVLTTTTATGAARAQALFFDTVELRFLPFDTRANVRRFLARVRPRLAFIIEKELWPNLLRECGAQGVAVVLASATISMQSLRRYRKIVGIFAETLREFTTVAAQSETDAAYFRELGVPSARVQVIGNLKFDISLPDEIMAAGTALRTELGWQYRCVLVAGSTYAAEEAALLEVQRRLRAANIDLALVLAPRHPPRFTSVADSLRSRGTVFVARSAMTSVATSPAAALPAIDVLLLDSLGDLLTAYAAADLAFVGGSLVSDVGGHNLIEPAALAVATLTGPYGYNSADIITALRKAGALTVVNDVDSLASTVTALAIDTVERRRRGELSQRFVMENRGALRRLLDLVTPFS